MERGQELGGGKKKRRDTLMRLGRRHLKRTFSIHGFVYDPGRSLSPAVALKSICAPSVHGQCLEFYNFSLGKAA